MRFDACWQSIMSSRNNCTFEQDRSLVCTYFVDTCRNHRIGLWHHEVPDGAGKSIFGRKSSMATRNPAFSYSGCSFSDIRIWANLEDPCLRSLSKGYQIEPTQRNRSYAYHDPDGCIRIPDPSIRHGFLANHLGYRSLRYFVSLAHRVPNTSVSPSPQKGIFRALSTIFQFPISFWYRTF